jgi:hypothetical protein
MSGRWRWCAGDVGASEHFSLACLERRRVARGAATAVSIRLRVASVPKPLPRRAAPEAPLRSERQRPPPSMRNPSAGVRRAHCRSDRDSPRARPPSRSRRRCSSPPVAAGRICARVRVPVRAVEAGEAGRRLADRRCSATLATSSTALRADHSTSRPCRRRPCRSGSRSRSCKCETHSAFRRGPLSLPARGRNAWAPAAGARRRLLSWRGAPAGAASSISSLQDRLACARMASVRLGGRSRSPFCGLPAAASCRRAHCSDRFDGS